MSFSSPSPVGYSVSVAIAPDDLARAMPALVEALWSGLVIGPDVESMEDGVWAVLLFAPGPGGADEVAFWSGRLEESFGGELLRAILPEGSAPFAR